MKISNLPLWVRGLAICLAFAGVSLASPIAVTGSLDETNCGGGGVQVTATMVNWLPPGTVGGTGCIVAGITTNVTWSGGGAILPGDVGNIMNLTFCANCNVPDFMVFNEPSLFCPACVPTLHFTLTSLPQAASSKVCDGSIVAGQSCVLVGTYTPFLLTYNGNIGGIENTQISAQAGGTVLDPNNGAPSNWGGSFNTTLNETPLQIEQDFIKNGFVQSTQEGKFTVTALPEPGSLLMMGGGLIGFALLLKRRTKRA